LEDLRAEMEEREAAVGRALTEAEVFTPGYVAEHGGGVGAIWGQLWTSVFVSAGVTTIVFAVLERSQARSHFLEAWDPRKLPALRRPSAIGRVGASIEMAVNLAAAVWWSANMQGPLVWPRCWLLQAQVVTGLSIEGIGCTGNAGPA
jgi:hypothetical protein